jgi:hypothetical protein
VARSMRQGSARNPKPYDPMRAAAALSAGGARCTSWARRIRLAIRAANHIIFHMKQLLIQLDDRTALELEKIAPGRSRKRSEFLRKVIARAVQDTLEAGTRAAYAKWPDIPPPFDPAEWASEDDAVRRASRKPARRNSLRGKRR